MFYTYANTRSNKLFVKLKDTDGDVRHLTQPCIFDVKTNKPLPIDLYSRRTNGSYKALTGERLEKAEFTSLEEANDFIRFNKAGIYGQTDLYYQFLVKNFTNVKPNFDVFVTTGIDIETDMDPTKPFDPNCFDFQILSVAFEDYHTRKKVQYGYVDIKTCDDYIKVKNEKELLLKVIEYFKQNNTDFITGWNSDRFDMRYIAHRLKKYKIDINQLSPFYNPNIRQNLVTIREDGLDIMGITILDGLALYLKYTFKNRPSYKLDYIAGIHLNKFKLDYNELGYKDLKAFYENDKEKFMEYNRIDVTLVLDLLHKLQFITTAISMAYMAAIRFEDVFSQMRFWDTYIYQTLHFRNIIIPPKRHDEKTEFEGAYVKDVTVGIHKYILSFDYRSLYPSAMRSGNMSYETYLHQVPIEDVPKYRSGELKLPPNTFLSGYGSLFRTDIQGIMPELVERVFNERVHYQGIMKDAKRKLKDEPNNKELKQILIESDSFQHIRKIAINSAYGVTGSPFFRYYRVEIAASITMTCQMLNKETMNEVNKFLNLTLGTNKDYVIAGDTDSIYVTLEDLVNKFYNDTRWITANKENKLISFLLGKYDCEPANENIDVVDFLDIVGDNVLAKVIANNCDKFSKAVGCRENQFYMKREKIATKGFFRAKKNYALLVADSEKYRYETPELNVTGLESVKSSTPPIIAEWLETSYNELLSDGVSNESLSEFFRKCKAAYNKLSLDDIALPIKADTEKLQSTTDINAKSLGPHIKGAILHNTLVDQYNLSIQKLFGGKMKYALLNTTNPYKAETISFLDSLPNEFGLTRYIDRNAMFDKSFGTPFINTANALGFDITLKSATNKGLGSFFK